MPNLTSWLSGPLVLHGGPEGAQFLDRDGLELRTEPLTPIGIYDVSIQCGPGCHCGEVTSIPRSGPGSVSNECGGSSLATVEGTTVTAWDWPRAPGQPPPDVGTLSGDGTTVTVAAGTGMSSP